MGRVEPNGFAVISNRLVEFGEIVKRKASNAVCLGKVEVELDRQNLSPMLRRSGHSTRIEAAASHSQEYNLRA